MMVEFDGQNFGAYESEKLNQKVIVIFSENIKKYG